MHTPHTLVAEAQATHRVLYTLYNVYVIVFAWQAAPKQQQRRRRRRRRATVVLFTVRELYVSFAKRFQAACRFSR